MRIVYAGSPDVSAIPLTYLLEEGIHEVVAVLTNPPSMQGRSKNLVSTPVAQAAQDANAGRSKDREITILTPGRLDASVRTVIESLNADILVCFAYGKIFGPKFLALFPRGGINLHPSLLPKYRGCAPVPSAILNRDSETGITIQHLAQEMDCGDILLQKKIPLTGRETAQSLLATAASIGGSLISEVLDQIEKGTVISVKQESQDACYCKIMCKNDGRLNWKESALDIDAKIRAFTPWPGAFTEVNGVVLRIHQAFVYEGIFPIEGENLKEGTILGVDKAKGIVVKTGDGLLVLTNLQWQSKKAMNWKDFLNGSKDFIGSQCN